MATLTPNYGLTKPAGTDTVNIDVINTNMDLLDVAVASKETPAGAQTKATTVQDNLNTHTSNTANPHSTTASQVGLGSVNNTSDAGKPVSSAQLTALNLKANLVSPTFTSVPKAPTAAVGTNTTQLASTAFVAAALAALVNSSPSTLDTLNELAAAIGDDPNYAATISALIGTKETPEGAQAKANIVQGNLTTHLADDATIEVKGHVQLSSSVTSTSETISATSKAVKTAYDKASVVTGTYVGNGADSQFINLGLTPTSVFINKTDGQLDVQIYGGMALNGYPVFRLYNAIRYLAIEIVSGGFNVFLNNTPPSTKPYTNTNGDVYYFKVTR